MIPNGNAKDNKIIPVGNMDNFGDWIETQLHIRDWRPADLARRANIGDATLSRILNQTRQAGPDVCRAIARALKVNEEIVFRQAGLLSPIPPPIAEEQEAIRILRQLSPEYRVIAINILHAIQPTVAVLRPHLANIIEQTAEYKITPGEEVPFDPYVTALADLWEQASEAIKAIFIAQLRATIDQATEPIALQQEIDLFLEQFPELEDIIVEAQNRLSEQAIRALLINVRIFATEISEREDFADLHTQLSNLFARLAS